MSKKFIVAAVVVLVAASVSVFAYMSYEKNSMGDFFNANVDALTAGEDGNVPTIPCEQSTSVCHYTVKDINGNYYNASTTGMRNTQ